jgi:hypothetical protein
MRSFLLLHVLMECYGQSLLASNIELIVGGLPEAAVYLFASSMGAREPEPTLNRSFPCYHHFKYPRPPPCSLFSLLSKANLLQTLQLPRITSHEVHVTEWVLVRTVHNRTTTISTTAHVL